MTPSLPAALSAALDARAHGLSRNDAAKRSAAISQTYRDGGGSQTITTEADALAYALVRMPATYAAVAACLTAITKALPNFAPASLLDCGAGPGTASFAATQAFALEAITLLDANPALRTLALTLCSDAHLAPVPHYDLGDIATTLKAAPAADLVIASYMIGEVADAARASLADALWDKTLHMLLVVEPGTPAGYQRIIDLRRRLIADGAHVLAPCPHDNACPLERPDWCHFVQRLPRSRAHKALKDADRPFEDEKFSYVALTRAAQPVRPARVLAQPEATKIGVTAKLCTSTGVVITQVARRDRVGHAQARRWRWGDAVMKPPQWTRSRRPRPMMRELCRGTRFPARVSPV